MVKVSASSAEDPGFKSQLSHTSDLKTGNQLASLPDTWCAEVSAQAGWPNVSLM